LDYFSLRVRNERCSSVGCLANEREKVRDEDGKEEESGIRHALDLTPGWYLSIFDPSLEGPGCDIKDMS
jgi:hypothetical protein